MNNQNSKLPSLFISHGGIGWTLDPRADYYKQLQTYSQKNKLLERTKTVIVISGHWEEKEVTVNLNPSPKITQNDHPFDNLYKYNFRFETNIELAKEIKASLEQNKIVTKTTTTENVDHGGWGGLFSVFDIEKQQQLYDEKKQQYIPKIVQISLHKGLDYAFHYRIGQILEQFRNQDTMILSSGSSSHSFRYFGNPQFPEWSNEWEQWLEEAIATKDEQQRKQLLLNVRSHKLFQFVQDSHEDHFLPLIVSLGTSRNPGTIFAQTKQMKALQTSFLFA